MRSKLVFFFCIAAIFPAVLVSKSRIKFSFFTVAQLGFLVLIFYMPAALTLVLHLSIFLFLSMALALNSYRLIR